MSTVEEIRVADVCWIALAELHRDWPDRHDFSTKEILARAHALEGTHPRAGVSPHVYQHNVANAAPSTAKYRMFFKTRDGHYRLWRKGDPSHPSRTGKTVPARDEIPSEYQRLLDWYEKDYSHRPLAEGEGTDLLLALRGEGIDLWRSFGLDEYVRGERDNFFASGFAEGPLSLETPGDNQRNNPDLVERVWERLREWEGAEFRTATGLPVSFKIDGSSLWFYRDGKRINKCCVRSQVDEAVRRCPIRKTTEIRDLIDYPYLFAVLMDVRIRKDLY